jgi:membrane-bound lytic murein transglycosylase F
VGAARARANKTLQWALIMLCAGLIATCGQPPSLLDEVLGLGELRVVTRNSPTTHYTGARGPEGPEYDLAKGFAQHLGVRLKLMTAERFAELIPAVETGAAHIAAAGLTITPERSRRVEFGPSYRQVKQLLIYRVGTRRPRSLADVDGKRLEVVSGSSYIETLEAAREEHPELVWSENPNADLASVLLDVAERRIDYTVADSSLFKIYRNYLPEIRQGLEIASDDSLAWAFPRRHDSSLLDQAAAYLAKAREEGFLNRLEERYYKRTQRFDYVGTRRFIRDFHDKLPAYREVFAQAGAEYGIDWRLLAAIGYQESHWDPEAVSPTGVRGIMMLTEATADVIGIQDRVDPEQSILGGAEYFVRTKERLPKSIKEPDRTWFALAAYNVGYGHVMDARRITAQLEKHPDRWVDVKKSLPLLAQSNWYEHTRHGYARGWEPVLYVENIRNYHDILVWLTRDALPDETTELEPIPTIAGDAPRDSSPNRS